MGRLKAVRRYRLGRDLIPLDLGPEVGCLEGRKVLRPGQVIALTGVPVPGGHEERQAKVESWTVVELGREGTVYRGVCRWLESGR
jgi:hypothetical protein